jgi:hypothetical protein
VITLATISSATMFAMERANGVAQRLGVSTARDGLLHSGIWLFREVARWAVITLLAALLLRLVWESRAAQDLVRPITYRYAPCDGGTGGQHG